MRLESLRSRKWRAVRPVSVGRPRTITVRNVVRCSPMPGDSSKEGPVSGRKQNNAGWLRCVGLVALVLVVLMVGQADAATVKLGVDPNTESDWVSDNLYRAPGKCLAPGAFAKVASAPKGPSVTFTDTVTADGDYCYAATAVDASGMESVQSNKVGVTVTENPPGAPPNLRQLPPVTP